MNSQESKLLYASSVVTKYEALLVFLSEEKLHAETMVNHYKSLRRRHMTGCAEAKLKFICEIQRRLEVYRGC